MCKEVGKLCVMLPLKSPLFPNHLPLQEPQISNTRQQAEAPQQQAQLSVAHDGVERSQGPVLARPQVQTGVEGAFQHAASQQVVQQSVIRPEVARPTAALRALEAPSTEVADVEEKPKNFLGEN